MGSTCVKNGEQIGLMGERQTWQGGLSVSHPIFLQEGRLGTLGVRQ